VQVVGRRAVTTANREESAGGTCPANPENDPPSGGFEVHLSVNWGVLCTCGSHIANSRPASQSWWSRCQSVPLALSARLLCTGASVPLVFAVCDARRARFDLFNFFACNAAGLLLDVSCRTVASSLSPALFAAKWHFTVRGHVTRRKSEARISLVRNKLEGSKSE
jgi:hypothetical protein